MLNIDATYGHTTALGHLAREFAPGRMYGLKGANGSGKSTLLATLGGELAALEGTVRVDGKEVGTRASASAVLTVADPIFLPDLTVGEHIDLIARTTGVDFAEIIELWALEELLPHPATRLSAGQRQRVFLAIQLYQPAQVLLIDEPERHLDHTWTAFLAEELRHLAANGRCVVLASHSPAIFDACDEVVDIS